MSYQEFYALYVRGNLKKHDKPYNRQLFNDILDSCQKDGIVTQKQAEKWIYPRTSYFY